jgi:hypothetical protein
LVIDRTHNSSGLENGMVELDKFDTIWQYQSNAIVFCSIL